MADGVVRKHILDALHEDDVWTGVPDRNSKAITGAKNVPFAWDADCQRVFEELKATLTSDAVLRMPDSTRPFVLTTDWSKLAVGAVLSQFQPVDGDDPASEQREYVIAYASRTLSPAETDYAPPRASA